MLSASCCGSEPVRRKGILALMPASVLTQWSCYDGSAWASSDAVARRRRFYALSHKHKTQQRHLPNVDATKKQDIPLSVFLSLDEAAAGAQYPVVVVLVLDPIQQHSVRLLEKVVEICGGDTRFRCLVVSQRPNVNMDGLLQHSGVGMLPWDETFGVWAITACNVSACPALVVLDGKVGRKFSSPAEVLAVENNGAVYVRSQWMLHQSAATSAQSLQAALCTIS